MIGFVEEMGDDEYVAAATALAISLPAAFFWYSRMRVTKLGLPSGILPVLIFTPLSTLLLLWSALVTVAAVEVRTDIRYQGLFLAMGGIWIFLLPRALGVIGVGYGDDALERRNPAAAAAIAGAVLGLGFLFAGSNVGEGPSIWNTVATAVAATAALAVLVGIVALAAPIGECVAVERDMPTGLRFGAFISGAGLILARAAAGNWVSTEAMLRDLALYGWPAVVLTGVAIALEHALRPRPSDPRPSVHAAGVFPAVAVLAVSIADVLLITYLRGRA